MQKGDKLVELMFRVSRCCVFFFLSEVEGSRWVVLYKTKEWIEAFKKRKREGR